VHLVLPIFKFGISLTDLLNFGYSEGIKKGKPRIWPFGGLPLKVVDMPYYTTGKGGCLAQIPLLPSFWLTFEGRGDPTAWIVEGLPQPNFIDIATEAYYIAWRIEGNPTSERAIEFLNDLIARFTLALDYKVERKPWAPSPEQRAAAHYYAKIYKMRELSRALPSLLAKRAKAPSRADNFDDYTFWAIKLWVEDRIRDYGGSGSPVPYQEIEDWACSQFWNHRKGISTVRAKCRSIWNWYDERDWPLPNRQKKDPEEVYMTRRERAITNAKKKAEKARRAVINAVTGLYADDLKKKSGAWHIGKIAEATGVNPKTVSMYLKEWQQDEKTL
jgi:hypothetical protein